MDNPTEPSDELEGKFVTEVRFVTLPAAVGKDTTPAGLQPFLDDGFDGVSFQFNPQGQIVVMLSRSLYVRSEAEIAEDEAALKAAEAKKAKPKKE